MLNELANEIHATAVDKGWWDTDRGFPEVLMLVTCEVAEAMEEYRHGRHAHSIIDGKPEGVPIELADIIIRVLDACGKYNIDIDAAVREKVEFNKTRPFRHGGLRA